MSTNAINSLELFSGAGGLALGLHEAGFQHVALVEKNAHAAKTLKLNCKDQLQMNENDIYNIDARTFDFNPYEGRIDLLAGGPPCQPFSTGGKNRAHLDSRDMFPVFLNAMKIVRPKVILIENVKGLLRPRFSEYFNYILRRIMFPFAVSGVGNFKDELQILSNTKETNYKADEQYKITYQLIDTADYGVPQRRERVIITAFRSDLGIVPSHIMKTHSKELLLRDQFVTGDYWKRHNIKKINFLGPADRNLLTKLSQERIIEDLNSKLSWKTVRDTINDLPPPVERGDIETFANHVQHPGARIYNGHVGSYHDLPAKALKAGTHGTPGGENILRINNSSNVRYFTTREAARLHTFPDSWKFNGETWGSCIKQLGNAVPVLIGKIFGEYLLDSLRRTNS